MHKGHDRALFEVGLSFCGTFVRGFAKKEKFQKCEITMEMGGWVQVSLRFFLKIVPK